MGLGDMKEIEISNRIANKNVRMLKIFRLQTSMLTVVESSGIRDNCVETGGCCSSLFAGLSFFSTS